MSVARKTALVAALSAVLAVSACSGADSDAAAPDGAATTDTSAVATTEAAAPPSQSDVQAAPTPEPQQQAAASATTRTPEEVSDLFPWNQPRPSLDSGNVDPALFATDLYRYNFTTPSGNVQCGIWAGGSPAGQVGCQAQTSVAPFEGRTCTNAENDKYAVRVNDGGAQHICTTQGIYTADEPRVLEYGQVLSAVGVVCESDEMFGVTCWGTEGAFMFARDWNVSWS
ncbi:hypothetical protein [Rhodococcoides fascians]|uniref:hypothetical protein n=1 Tax=Rhodococcoides fascians TaxID=1828 RepID=UPI00056BA33D|nr:MULTISPECIES: hypothetical protein [Rhodococcus]OZE99471.1 hypothetical protein CH301_15080 [Rhodococcus sp. 15-1189-1-1a]OZF13761.1 hypothetical protein CH299_14860 [Rhodococcus sp. 14-2686-1-2]